MPLLSACLAIALLLSPLAAAQPPYEDDQAPADPRVTQAYRSYHARAAEALAAQGDARGLAIAALLLPPTDSRPVEGVVPDDEVPSQPVATDPRVALWRQQASAAAGGDVLADALLSSIDVGGEADVTLGRAAAARWRAAEPDNLAPRLAAGDPIEMVLADAGSLRRFDLHYLDTTRAIAAALRAHPPTEAERALLAPDGAPVDEIAALAASGMASALTLPSLRPLFEACSPAATDDMPARADACRGVAETMRSSSDSALGGIARPVTGTAHGDHARRDRRGRR